MKAKDNLFKKSKGSLPILIAVAILGFLAFLVIVAGIALMSHLTGNNAGAPSTDTSLFSCTASNLSKSEQSQIQKNLSVYQSAAKNADVPWELLAAIHFRESNLSTTSSNPFQMNTNTHPGFNIESATDAGRHARSIVQSVYGRNLSSTSGEETIKLALLAYNRGSMYVSGGCTVDQSPYVMNQYDAAHRNMTWPNNSCEPPSTRGQINIPLGGYTVFSILKGCITSKLSGKTALPISESKINGYNNTLHGKSVSDPTSKPGHNVILGPGTYFTNIPDNSLGEAVDLASYGGTPVFAPFDGQVTYASSPSALSSGTGGYLVLQSIDGKSAAVLAHLQNFVAKGKIFAAGEKLGELKGWTGGLGPHLHFELWVNGKPVNAGGPGSGVTPAKIWQAQKKALGF